MSPLDRRTFLQATVATTCAACLPLAGCRSAESADAGPLRVALDTLPEGRRIRHEHAGRPLELLRRGDAVTARSLLCTHQGCEVIWKPEAEEYLCPCHDGVFDGEGHPVYGPPRRALREIVVIVRDGLVVVDG